jgi:hypothetical protein
MTDVFRRMASLVTLVDLMSLLGPELSSDASVEDSVTYLETCARRQRYDPSGRISLITNAGRVIGWIDLETLATVEQSNLIRVALPIPPDQILTANMTALSAANLICSSSKPFYFVLEDNTFIGTVGYANLFSLPFRLCLFSLTLQLEQTALSLLLQDAESSIDALNENRRTMAEEVFARRYGGSMSQSPSGLLRCTNFVDKSKILAKRKLLEGMSANQINSTFSRAETVRNHCAHPDSEERGGAIVLERQKLAAFIEDTTQLIRLMIQRDSEDKV